MKNICCNRYRSTVHTTLPFAKNIPSKISLRSLHLEI